MLAAGGRCIPSTPLRALGQEEDRRCLANVYMCAVDAAHESWRKKPNGGINLPPPPKKNENVFIVSLHIHEFTVLPTCYRHTGRTYVRLSETLIRKHKSD